MATPESHLETVSPLTRAVIEWLDLNYPNEDHVEPGWVLHSMIESRYWGGLAQFVEDLEMGSAVS